MALTCLLLVILIWVQKLVNCSLSILLVLHTDKVDLIDALGDAEGLLLSNRCIGF